MTTCLSDYVRHAELADDVYESDDDRDARFERVGGDDITDDAGTDLFARVYKHGDEYVIAFRGTDSITDAVTDYNNIIGNTYGGQFAQLPGALVKAFEYIKKDIDANNGDITKAKISYTGHEAVTFDATRGGDGMVNDAQFIEDAQNARDDISVGDGTTQGLGFTVGEGNGSAITNIIEQGSIVGNSRLTAPYYSNNRTETRSLREMVEAFKATNTDGSPNLDKTAREALAENILLRWAGDEGAVGSDYWRGRTSLGYTTAQKVAVVEAFQGKQWLKDSGYRNPAYSTAQNFSIN